MEEKRCYGCMKLKTSGPVCEHCGYDERTPNDPHRLPAGTVLREQYMVGRVLGQGGFGITYLGWDLYLDIPVAIKEYFPKGLVMRDATVTMDVVSYAGDEGSRFRNNKEKFMQEAKMLARFSQVPEIVQVKNFFLANNTAYIVMEYVEGITLKQHVQNQGGHLSIDETFRILRPIIEALCKVHKAHLVHRDISPDNIMMLPQGGAKLLDFGAVRDVGVAEIGKELDKSTQAILKQGYAPIEQYQKRGSLGPWTDVYALCATIYYCLTGQVPPDAPERLLGYDDLNLKEKIPALSERQLKALEHGMALKAEDRIRTMDDLYQELFVTKPEPVPVHEPKPEPKPQPAPVRKAPAEKPAKKPAAKKQPPKKTAPPKPKKRSLLRPLILCAAVAVAILGMLYWIGINSREGEEIITGSTISGECTQYSTWTLDRETGELVIDGANAMRNYRPEWQQMEDRELPPWYEYRAEITKVTVTGLVTSVGEYAFAGLENLKTVEIGGAVENIRKGAFQNSGLEEVFFSVMGPSTEEIEGLIGEAKQESSANLSVIYENAFRRTALKAVTLPDTVTSIGTGAFAECGNLTRVTMDKTAVPSYDTWKGCVFTDENGNIPEDLTIYCYACTPAADYAAIWGIKSVLTDNSWDVEGTCGSKLTYHIDLDTGFLKIDGSGTMTDYNGPWQQREAHKDSWQSGRTLAPWADYRASLKVLSIGDEVSNIGENAFSNCNIRDVYFGKGLKALDPMSFLESVVDEIVLPDSVTSVGHNAFNWCSALTYVELSENIATLEDSAFNQCLNLRSFFVGGDTKFLSGTKYTPFTQPGETNLPKNLTIYSLQNSNAEKLANEQGIAFEIGIRGAAAENQGQCGDDAWWFISGDTLYIYGSGDTWYYGLSEEEITGWAKKDYDGGRAFQGRPEIYNYVEKIQHVVILPGIKTLNHGLLTGLYAVKTVDLGTITTLRPNFSSCQNLKEVVIPETVKTIGGYAFDSCQLLESVTIQGSPKIDAMAFVNCTMLKDIYFNGGKEKISDNSQENLFNIEGETSYKVNSGLTFHVRKYSDAQRYAKEYGIAYEIIK